MYEWHLKKSEVMLKLEAQIASETDMIENRLRATEKAFAADLREYRRDTDKGETPLGAKRAELTKLHERLTADQRDVVPVSEANYVLVMEYKPEPPRSPFDVLREHIKSIVRNLPDDCGCECDCCQCDDQASEGNGEDSATRDTAKEMADAAKS